MRGRKFALIPVILAGAALLHAQTPPPQQPVSTPASQAPVQALAKVYANNCASCHGENQEGGRGPALDSALLAQRSDEQIHTTLENGKSGGMPAFKGLLPDEDLLHMANYLRVRAADRSTPPFKLVEPAGQLIHTSKQDFRLEVAVGDLNTPWGLVFLPDGRKLVTERPGLLRIIDKKWRLLPEPVSGVPETWVRQDGGYFDVAIDPDYKRNHWVYLSFSEVLPGHVVTPAEAATPGPGVPRLDPPSMTTFVRGRIDRNNRWVDQQVIYRAPANLYTREGSHYGTRFLFDKQGHLFYSIGERGAMSNAQPLDTPLGKIHRINVDGSVPADNPFVNTPGAISTIWTYGHRNPEGLAFDPVTGALWESEHGPVAGDEINIIEKGHNYGWGVISNGLQPGISKREAPGMESPITSYTPTLAPSGITFYTGNRYPGWKNNLFVAGLAGQQLRRLQIDGRKVVEQEILFQRYGRTRDVVQGPDGYLYVLMQRSPAPGTPGTANSPGWIIRLVPAKAG